MAADRPVMDIDRQLLDYGNIGGVTVQDSQQIAGALYRTLVLRGEVVATNFLTSSDQALNQMRETNRHLTNSGRSMFSLFRIISILFNLTGPYTRQNEEVAEQLFTTEALNNQILEVANVGRAQQQRLTLYKSFKWCK